LLVWDDANMNGIVGDATGEDNYNESWAYVKVEDKLKDLLLVVQSLLSTMTSL